MLLLQAVEGGSGCCRRQDDALGEDASNLPVDVATDPIVDL